MSKMKYMALEHVNSPKPDNFVAVPYFLHDYQSDFLGYSHNIYRFWWSKIGQVMKKYIWGSY